MIKFDDINPKDPPYSWGRNGGVQTHGLNVYSFDVGAPQIVIQPVTSRGAPSDAVKIRLPKSEVGKLIAALQALE